MKPDRDENAEPDEFERLVQRELDGEISPEDEARLQQLLVERPELTGRYREDRALSDLFRGRRETRPGPPTDLADRIVNALETAPERPQPAAPEGGRVVSMMAWGRPMMAAAALLLLVAGGFWAGRQTTSAESSSFERDVVEKFRNTVREQNLPRDEAEQLLDHFRRERERLAREEDEGLKSAAEALEVGLRELTSRGR